MAQPAAPEAPPAIVVEGLHEVFRVYSERPPGIKERLQGRRAAYTEFHALSGIDVTIGHGERVGLIGHNGSGKSTLLKCMARILPADRGRVVLNGRVATLLELGAGFSPDLSGRENVFLNGSILGLTRREITAAFDSIVDFAGVGDFIDMPVRNYSSGMYVRLGFAIAVHVDPDILLVDEVLSVGDATFQQKSLAAMQALAESGKTIVLVSHDLAAMQALCRRGVVLDHGRVAFDGPIEQALTAYERIVAAGRAGPAAVPHVEVAAEGDQRATITGVRMEAPGHDVRVQAPAEGPVTTLPSGAKARLEVEATCMEDLVGQGGLTVGFTLRRRDLPAPVYETRTAWRVVYLAPPPPGVPLRVVFDLELQVLTGTYVVDVELGNAETDVVHDRRREALEIAVEAAAHDVGITPLGVSLSVHNPEGVWPAESLPPSPEAGGPRYHARRDGPRGSARDPDADG